MAWADINNPNLILVRPGERFKVDTYAGISTTDEELWPWFDVDGNVAVLMKFECLWTGFNVWARRLWKCDTFYITLTTEVGCDYKNKLNQLLGCIGCVCNNWEPVTYDVDNRRQ